MSRAHRSRAERCVRGSVSVVGRVRMERVGEGKRGEIIGLLVYYLLDRSLVDDENTSK